MDDLIESIRIAIAEGSNAEAKATAVAACRQILATLEPAPSAPALTPETLVAAASALRGVPLEQLLDLVIQRLRGALPTGTEPVRSRSIQLQLVPIPQRKHGS